MRSPTLVARALPGSIVNVSSNAAFAASSITRPIALRRLRSTRSHKSPNCKLSPETPEEPQRDRSQIDLRRCMSRWRRQSAAKAPPEPSAKANLVKVRNYLMAERGYG